MKLAVRYVIPNAYAPNIRITELQQALNILLNGCKTHRAYRAYRTPNAPCKECDFMWEQMTKLRDNKIIYKYDD